MDYVSRKWHIPNPQQMLLLTPETIKCISLKCNPHASPVKYLWFQQPFWMALQHSCLENIMDRRAWQATVHRVANSQTQLSDWAHTHTHTHTRTHTHIITEVLQEELLSFYHKQIALKIYKRQGNFLKGSINHMQYVNIFMIQFRWCSHKTHFLRQLGKIEDWDVEQLLVIVLGVVMILRYDLKYKSLSTRELWGGGMLSGRCF